MNSRDLVVHCNVTTDQRERLVLDFLRYADNDALTWFISEFCNHKFVVETCDLLAQKKGHNGVTEFEHEVKLSESMTSSIPRMPDWLPDLHFVIRVRLTFHRHVHKPEQLPGFVRLFAGLDDGELPEFPKPVTVWERLRQPLV